MKSNIKKYFILAGILFLIFIIFTVFVCCFDVKMIGPAQSAVGFSRINQFVFQLFGVHLVWYYITDWLGVIAVLFALVFAAAGLYQLVKRKSLKKVDIQILILGGFYILVIAFYLFFEQIIINYRPILLNGNLEASYPSSHTMIVMCIMCSSSIAAHSLLPNKKALCIAADIAAVMLSAITVIGRLISGVHWFSDILGGILLSSALVVLFCAVIKYAETHIKLHP